MFDSLQAWLYGRPPKEPPDLWPLTLPLVQFSHGDTLRLLHALEGVFIMGGSGSAKSTSSGKVLAESYLSAGLGGLVLCAKPDECANWQKFAKRTGRGEDLVIFRPDQPWRFNPIDFARSGSGEGGGDTADLLALVETMQQACDPGRVKKQSGGDGNTEFFRIAAQEMTAYAIDGVIWGTGQISIDTLHQFITSMPRSEADLNSARWADNSFCIACLAAGGEKPKNPRQDREWGELRKFLFHHWLEVPDKTRQSIVATFTVAANLLRRGTLHELHGGETNVDPSAMAEGKIIIVDLPVLQYGRTGLASAMLWKHSAMKYLPRRNLRQSPRPVFIWQDEGQNFVAETDQAFQCVCRSFRVAVVTMTQSISNILAVFGGEANGKALADGYLGNLKFRIMHCNGDSVSNTWSSKLIGKTSRFMVSASQHYQGNDFGSTLLGIGPSQSSASVSEQIQYDLEPACFTNLRTGGERNNFLADAVLFCDGTTFKATGKRWRYATFSQK